MKDKSGIRFYTNGRILFPGTSYQSRVKQGTVKHESGFKWIGFPKILTLITILSVKYSQF